MFDNSWYNVVKEEMRGEKGRMRKWFMAILCIAIISGSLATTSATTMAEVKDEMRGVWISTVYCADYPSTKKNVEMQKQEFITKLDQAQKIGLNSVFVQVRPKSDAFYSSNINPWSEILTGVQGQHPGFDPMEFMISEVHKRNMEFHAWLNPYRITTKGTDLNTLASNHPARLHPNWVITHKDALYYNPALPEVKEYLVNTVTEIIENYNVDGIHFDDYFYPTGYPLSSAEGRDGAEANQRRQDVNDMIRMVSNAIDRIRPEVEFGVSPVGIWKNQLSDPSGSNTKGYEGYYAVFGDARTWIREGYVDYIAPQIYWEIGNSAADYETLLQWWSNEVKGTDVQLYIGQGIYKDVVAKEITNQLKLNEKYNTDGSIFFSLRDLLNNRQGCNTALKNYYQINQETQNHDSTEKNETKSTDQDSSVNKAETIDAFATSAKVQVDGKPIVFEAYTIDDYNYFKLRDIGMAISGSEKEFNPYWNEDENAVQMQTNTSYVITGGELTQGDGKNKKAVISLQKMYLDGQSVNILAYNINGNNYFKLRDIATLLNMGVSWDEDSQTIDVNTTMEYQE